MGRGQKLGSVALLSDIEKASGVGGRGGSSSGSTLLMVRKRIANVMRVQCWW